MKKILFYIFALLLVNQSFAQIKDGTRIFTATGNLFNASFNKNTSSDSISSNSTTSSSIVFSPGVTYGKVKNNSLLSYGLRLYLSRSTYSTSDNGKPYYYPISFGPIISYQKFYNITPQLYFTPSATFSLAYTYSRDKGLNYVNTQKGITSSVYFYPFSLTFSKNQKTNFIINLGAASIGYSNTVYRQVSGSTENKNTNSSFNINANFSGMGVGIQRLF